MTKQTSCMVIMVLLVGPVFGSTSLNFRLDEAPTAWSRSVTLLQLSQSDSYEKGWTDAKLHHATAGWAVGGVVSGVLFNFYGAGIIALIALVGSNPSPPFVPDDVDASAYTRGYREAARIKTVWAAGKHGLISSGIMILVWLVVLTQVGF